MIALCGMNCALCIRNQTPAKDDPSRPSCLGCRLQNKSCAFIKKKCLHLVEVKKGEINYCYQCSNFPCEALEKLDTMYKKRYDFSMITNQKEIKAKGLAKFLAGQQEKYACAKCDGLVCVHEKRCLKCDPAKK